LLAGDVEDYQVPEETMSQVEETTEVKAVEDDADESEATE